MTILSRAIELYAFLDERSARNEDAGCLSDDTVAALRDGGFFSLMVPHARGGVEASPTRGIEVIEALSRADGSPAWVVLACNVATAAAAAYLGGAESEEVFSGPPPIIAGQGAPNGKALPEGDGFRVTGRWNYGSGILHASHVHACAMIMDGDAPRRLPSGDPEIRMFVIDPRDVQLHRDWDVVGLRATASIDYSVSGAFVTEKMTYPARSNSSAIGGDLYKLGIPGFALIGHTGFALGTGRRSLDEIAKIAQSSIGFGRNLSSSDKFLQDYASAEASLLSARAFVLDVWTKAEDMLRNAGSIDVRQMTLLRLALVHSTDVAAEVCTFAYRAAGGQALRRGALERCLRDIMAAAQHIHVSPKILADCGREISGLAPDAKWAPFALIPTPRIA